MDKVMAFLMKYIGGFFAWWKELTGLEYKYYEKLGFGVNWPVISFGLLVMLAMVLFLPGGVGDSFIW